MNSKLTLSILLYFCICTSVKAQDPTQEILKGTMGSSKSAEKLPETYAFNWEFKTNMEITSKKKSNNANYDMNFLLNTNKDYYGMQLDSEEMKKMGSPPMVFDFKSEVFVMFMSYGGQNKAMLQKLKDPASKKITREDIWGGLSKTPRCWRFCNLM